MILLLVCVCVGGVLQFYNSNRQRLSNDTTTSAPSKVTPTVSIPTIEPSYLVEYYVDLNVNALCTSDAQQMGLLEQFGIPIEYNDYSSGKRERKYVNNKGIGLPPSAFPWSYQFTLKKSATRSGDYLNVSSLIRVTNDYSCHAVSCKIFLNGVEIKSKASIIKDKLGRDRPTGYMECDISISDIDW